MPDPTATKNEQRADRAYRAVLSYCHSERDDEDIEAGVTDLIADMLHLCDQYGVEQEELQQRVLQRYQEERATVPPKVRKRTRLEYCDRHRAIFLSESLYRRVEVMVEGGWAHGGPCEGGRCKLYPGRDYICRETCEEYGLGEMPLDWTTPDQDDGAAGEYGPERARQWLDGLNAAVSGAA